MINAPDAAVWFMGDLSDPWVVSIIEALAGCAGIVQVHCPGDLPDRPFAPDQAPALLVIHRQRMTALDAQRLKEYRVSSPAGSPPAIVLCISPYVRYAELERWSSLVDLVISEATAPDTLPCHVTRLFGEREDDATRPTNSGLRIEVAGNNHDLCQAVVDACAGAGYQTHQVANPEVAGAAGARNSPSRPSDTILTIWEVPILEPDWSQRLERRARASGPVIALVGFPDRDTVTVAKASGAIACLDLPYNVDNLIDVIDRVAPTFSTERRSVPARVEQPHRLPPPPRRRKEQRQRPTTALPSSNRDGKPTVN